MAALLAGPHAVRTLCRPECTSSTTTASARSRALLEASGHAVVGDAADGEQALAAARRLHPRRSSMCTCPTPPASRSRAGSPVMTAACGSFSPPPIRAGRRRRGRRLRRGVLRATDELAVSDLATWLDRRSLG
jgi:hypothetical protein